MSREIMRKMVYSIFSDTFMILLAFMVIPLLIIQFVELTPTQFLIVEFLNWIVYCMFFLEFLLKVYVAENRVNYLKQNKLDALISLIIIISPIFEMITIYFAEAPLLRLLRISRVVRLGGILGKSKTEWKQVHYKSYLLVGLVISTGFGLSFFRPHFELSAADVTWLSIFIQVIGIIFGLFAAFMIVNAWNGYNSLEDSLRKETLSLGNIFILSLELNNESAVFESLRKNLLEYTASVLNTYWKESTKISETNLKFIQVYKTLERFNPTTDKGHTIFDNINEEMRLASTQRSNVLSLIAAKTPKVLWIFIIALSFILITSFMIVNFDDQWIATLVVTMVSIAIAFVIVVIYDISYPFKGGFWAISPQNYFDLENTINEVS